MQTQRTLLRSAAILALALWLAQPLATSVRAADKQEPKAQAPKAKAVELQLDNESALILDTNRNGMPAKTKIIPTASYEAYLLAPIVDGNKKRKDLSWQEAAWASVEDESAHGLEIQLSQPQHGGRFQVTWAYDANGAEVTTWWASRDYVIQVKNEAGDDWKTVADVKNNQSTISSHPLPEKPFRFLRIYQLAGGGHPSRPNIMWIGQVELAD
jgi:hypothetical protein